MAGSNVCKWLLVALTALRPYVRPEALRASPRSDRSWAR